MKPFLACSILLAVACAESNGPSDVALTIDAGVTFDGDGGPTLPEDTGPPAGCDQDEDGFLAEHCGGDDCDDSARGINPNSNELCSFEDENCSGTNNERLDCTFYAHGPNELYRVDPFAELVHPAGLIDTPSRFGVQDIDIDANGSIIGVTRRELLRLESDGTYEVLAAIETPANTNGLAINSSDQIFLTQKMPAGETSQAYTVTLDGSVSVLGNLEPFQSSGDCVVLKDDSLLMTAPGDDGDILVYVDSRDASTRPIGAIGSIKVYGLSASFGYLFGVTDEGRVLLIDANTGAGEELFRREDLRFWGAANGD
jgi:hypothetical protein